MNKSEVVGLWIMLWGFAAIIMAITAITCQGVSKDNQIMGLIGILEQVNSSSPYKSVDNHICRRKA